MNQQDIDAFFQASIARRPVPPPPCSHTGMGYYIDYVEGRHPGRALKCNYCHKVLAIKPDIGPEDRQTIEWVKWHTQKVIQGMDSAEWWLAVFIVFIALLAGLGIGMGL